MWMHVCKSFAYGMMAPLVTIECWPPECWPWLSLLAQHAHCHTSAPAPTPAQILDLWHQR
jgi:hypothetical protein